MSTLAHIPGAYGPDVYEGFGTFWSKLYSDSGVVRALSYAYGLAISQNNLNTLEVFDSLGRRTVPISHRELRVPIKIRRSKANTGDSVALLISKDTDVYLGYEGTKVASKGLHIGGSLIPAGYVAYPIENMDIAGGCITLTDKAVRPSVLLIGGNEYHVQGNTIYFRAQFDPFKTSAYIREEVYTNAGIDQELTLWASDVLVTNTYLEDSFGDTASFRATNKEWYKRAMNAVADLAVNPGSDADVNTTLGVILGVPTIREVSEVVTAVTPTKVTTDHNTYSIPKGHTLVSTVVHGAVLLQGTFLTTACRVYHDLDVGRMAAEGGTSLDSFTLDAPFMSVLLGHESNRLNVYWGDVPISSRGVTSKGEPRVYFSLGGSEESTLAYWEQVWAQAESTGTDLTKVFKEHITHKTGTTIEGVINPLKFFLSNFLKTHTFLIVIDFDVVPDYVTTSGVLTSMKEVLPIHTSYHVHAQVRMTNTIQLDNVSDSVTYSSGDRVTEEAGTSASLDYLDYQPIVKWVKK